MKVIYGAKFKIIKRKNHCNPEGLKKVRRRRGSQFRKRTRVGILWSSKVYKNFWVHMRTINCGHCSARALIS